MKKIINILLGLMLLTVSACGYNLMGTSASYDSILGSGEKTIAISKIEQSSLFPWVSYELRTELHSEMQMRKYAKWASIEQADYLMEANLTSFETRAYLSGEEDETLLSTVSANLVIKIYDRNNNLIWTSGNTNFSENYQHIHESSAIKEIIKELVYLTYDKMQDTF